ncbi:hypothetical protein EV359DRAFT_48217, partial [Lentinula novae-zelandiae]
MLDSILLAEIDAALRYAKEKPDDYFGGINIIFAGDLFQYPPVGTALYTPIRSSGPQTVNEMKRRLGRFAWKAINEVVTLTEQKRMEVDVEYAAAVARLRIRECTEADVELFNTRV